jgi:hypothetical protein
MGKLPRVGGDLIDMTGSTKCSFDFPDRSPSGMEHVRESGGSAIASREGWML